MSTNVYGPQDGPAPDFLRNTYDKQFQNLITTNFGDLRVCFCKEVLPGDSVNIDPVVAIRSQPIVFPIQTRMKFYCHFFYGRNRILMKNWEDFIFKTKDGIVPPLLRLTPSRAKKMISTGSLGDNLGIPSTIGAGSSDFDFIISLDISPLSYGFYGYNRKDVIPVQNLQSFFINTGDIDGIRSRSRYAGYRTETVTEVLRSNHFEFNVSSIPFGTTLPEKVYVAFVSPFNASSSAGTEYTWLSDAMPADVSLINEGLVSTISFDVSSSYSIYQSSQFFVNNGIDFQIAFLYQINNGSAFPPFFPDWPANVSSSYVPTVIDCTLAIRGIYDSTDDLLIRHNAFVGSNPVIPLSALPFRLYEFICNYYYRNDTNNPYVIDGEPQYNRFIPTTDDGWDENEYLIHKRNWESDMFTTCVPSPQFGTAPLVGLTYNGGLTAKVSTNVTDSDGQTKELDIQVGVDDEGYINSIINADTGVPSGSLKQLMDAMSTTGISINTLRNVNSFQRFLENVIRRGLRYRNQLLSHFGVSVDYPDIDIPQFIGGFSGDLVVREVTNMAESAEVALGDVAGKIDAVIQSNHSINCYCAEHGFIMGIFSIVPVPTYSQVLPHMFTRYDAFDYFQKEFDKIGYVPVTYRNFLPLQVDNPDEVFGYQRAWYEYMSSLDEVHGDFRMSLDDFVLYRVFNAKPTLNETFIKVDSESLNNIFAVDKVDSKYKDADKFMCQFYFQYTQKTMIPKHGVASLE